jgi:hypothetical protein
MVPQISSQKEESAKDFRWFRPELSSQRVRG